MATAQQPKNRVNSGPTSTMATPVCVCECERERGRGVCVCVHHSKAALSCADQAIHAAQCHSPGLTAGSKPPGVSSLYLPIAKSLRPLCSSVHSTDHRYTRVHVAKVNEEENKVGPCLTNLCSFPEIMKRECTLRKRGRWFRWRRGCRVCV